MTRRRLSRPCPRSGARRSPPASSLAQPFRPSAAQAVASGLIPEDRAGVPNWKVDEQFKKDVFTFVRIEYDSFGRRRFRWWRWFGGGGGGRRRRRRVRRLWRWAAGRPTSPTAT